jgi:hypothetical protein
MNKPSLAIAYYFHQVFPAITAITHYRTIHHLKVEAPLLIHAPYVKVEERKLICAAFPWITFLQDGPRSNARLAKLRLAIHTFMPIAFGSKILKRLYVADFFQAIYFPHDVTSDFTPQFFMQAFPLAQRICYGDAFGNLINKRTFEKKIYQNKMAWRSFFSLLKRKFKTVGCGWLTLQAAVLMVPVGLSKNCFDSQPLFIVPQAHVLALLKKLQTPMQAFNKYIDDLCQGLSTSTYVLPLGHLAQAGMATLENEFLLYREILQMHLPENATLVLKAHPGGSFEETCRLADWAKERGHPTFIFSKDFLHVPIEFAENLIKSCQVLSISYASISLPYLYGVSVKHVLDESLIDKYCFNSRKNLMQHYNAIYALAQKRLGDWTGNTALFCEE